MLFITVLTLNRMQVAAIVFWGAGTPPQSHTHKYTNVSFLSFLQEFAKAEFWTETD